MFRRYGIRGDERKAQPISSDVRDKHTHPPPGQPGNPRHPFCAGPGGHDPRVGYTQVPPVNADIGLTRGQYVLVGFPRNRGGILYAASDWMTAIFSYSIGGSNPAELCRR